MRSLVENIESVLLSNYTITLHIHDLAADIEEELTFWLV
jgi:hypothetical protein